MISPAARCWFLLLAVAALSCPAIAHAAPDLRFELVEHATPGRMCPGEGRAVSIVLRNAGTLPWAPDADDRVAYHWLDAAGKPFIFEGRRTELPEVVPPGGTVRLDAVIEAPLVPGTYGLQWAMVREHVLWSPSEPAPVDVEVMGAGLPLSWAIEDAGQFASLPAKSQSDVEITVQNTGCATWSARAGDALAYHWWGPDGLLVTWEGQRTPMPDVEPGDTVTVRATVRAPGRMGHHRLQWEPVRDEVSWYGEPTRGDRNRAVAVDRAALAWSLVDGGKPPKLHAGQTATVELTIRNDGVLPWSDETSDHVSYHWLGPDGVTVVAEGLRTQLPRAVDPGKSIVVGARLRAPDVPGRYRLAWEPVREHVAWFGPPLHGGAETDEPRGFAVDVAVPKLAWAIEAVDDPWVLWAGRTDTLDVIIRNEGAETWSVEAGDRLSYRWRDAESGEVVIADGLRTKLPQAVEPGASIELDARVRAPLAPGRYLLELEMVREHVRWYGEPTDPSRAQIEVRSMRGSAVGGLAWLAVVGGVVLVWRRQLGPPRARAVAAEIALPIGFAFAVYMFNEVFADLSGLEPWAWTQVVAFSGAALWGLALLALPARYRPIAATTAAGLLFLLTLADLAYIHFFGSIVPLGAFVAFHQLADASGTVASLFAAAHLWLWPIALSVPALAFWGPQPRPQPGTEQASPGRARPILALVLLGISVPAIVRLGAATLGGLGAQVFSEQHNVGRLGLVNAHAFQVGRAMRSWAGPAELGEVERREVAAFYAAHGSAGVGRGFGVAAGSNVIVVQVEALQDWVVDAKVDGRPVMPFLAGAHEQALHLTQVFDQTSQGRTSDAEYLVLQSNQPMAEGALSFLREDATFHTMMHVLGDAGYATLSAHPYDRGFWNRATIHPRYGFATSLFERELGEGPRVGWGLADGPFFERMVGRLDEQAEPFAAFLITVSLHHPYEEFPEALETLTLGDLDDTPVGNYLHAMNYFDRSLQTFIGELDRRGLLDHTVVMVYGDHVAGLDADPHALAMAGIERWEPSVPMRLHRVPAFVWVPGKALHGRIDRVGGQIDLGATVLHLLGVAPPPSFIGRPLVRSGPGFAALANGSAVSDDRMYVAVGQDIGHDGACFDYPGGTARPLEDCRPLAKKAERELVISRRALDHDLLRNIPEL